MVWNYSLSEEFLFSFNALTNWFWLILYALYIICFMVDYPQLTHTSAPKQDLCSSTNITFEDKQPISHDDNLIMISGKTS